MGCPQAKQAQITTAEVANPSLYTLPLGWAGSCFPRDQRLQDTQRWVADGIETGCIRDATVGLTSLWVPFGPTRASPMGKTMALSTLADEARNLELTVATDIYIYIRGCYESKIPRSNFGDRAFSLYHDPVYRTLIRQRCLQQDRPLPIPHSPRGSGAGGPGHL